MQLDQAVVSKCSSYNPPSTANAAASNSPIQQEDSQHSHASSHALNSPASHRHLHGCVHHSCGKVSQRSVGSASNESQSTQTSGYQTDNGTFEEKVLHRASPDCPANLLMTVICDYNPCCKQELAVRKGQRVKVQFKNNDWVYAVTKYGGTGYIPFHFVRPSHKNAGAGYQLEPKFCNDHKVHIYTDMPSVEYCAADSSLNTCLHCCPCLDACSVMEYSRPTEGQPHCNPFQRQFFELVVIHDFDPEEKDEVFVRKGERVRVLNAEDAFWLLVETISGKEGYIPRSCCSIGDHPCKLCRLVMTIHLSLIRIVYIFIDNS